MSLLNRILIGVIVGSVVSLAGLVACYYFVSVPQQVAKRDIANARTEIAKLKAENSKLTSDLNDASKRIEEMKRASQYLASLNTSNGRITGGSQPSIPVVPTVTAPTYCSGSSYRLGNTTNARGLGGRSP